MLHSLLITTVPPKSPKCTTLIFTSPAVTLSSSLIWRNGLRVLIRYLDIVPGSKLLQHRLGSLQGLISDVILIKMGRKQEKNNPELKLNWIPLEKHQCSLKCKVWSRGRQELRLLESIREYWATYFTQASGEIKYAHHISDCFFFWHFWICYAK